VSKLLRQLPFMAGVPPHVFRLLLLKGQLAQAAGGTELPHDVVSVVCSGMVEVRIAQCGGGGAGVRPAGHRCCCKARQRNPPAAQSCCTMF
jgi:hypothetical protein